MSLDPVVAKLAALVQEAMWADLAGSTWYLTRRLYTRAGDAKRYALASGALGLPDVDGETVIHELPAGATHAILVDGTDIVEAVALPAYEAGECLSLRPARGWRCEIAPH